MGEGGCKFDITCVLQNFALHNSRMSVCYKKGGKINTNKSMDSGGDHPPVWKSPYFNFLTLP